MNETKISILIIALMMLLIPIAYAATASASSSASNSDATGNSAISITTDTQTVYVGELKTVVFTVNVKSSCNPSSGEACITSGTLVPLSDANVQLQGAATGGGATNGQGQRTMTINAANTGTITATASKSGYIDGSVTINVENRPKPPPSLKIITDTPTVNVGESKSVTFTITTENTCGPSAGQACPMAATTDQNEIPVSDVNVHLEGCAHVNGMTDSNGNAIITVKANCAGTITAIASKSGYTNGEVTIDAKQLATPTPYTPTPTPYTPTPTPYTPTPTPYTPTPTPYTPTPTPIQTLTQSNFRVGPTVNLRPVKDDISKSEDGLIELYMDNPSLNDVTMRADVRISVPSGISVYGQGFGDAGSAGVMHGVFDIAPGKARTIQMTIKAERTGNFLIKFSGLYWPGNNKDAFRPISLTHNFKVHDISEPIIIPTITTKDDKDNSIGILEMYRTFIKSISDFLDNVFGPTGYVDRMQEK